MNVSFYNFVVFFCMNIFVFVLRLEVQYAGALERTQIIKVRAYPCKTKHQFFLRTFPFSPGPSSLSPPSQYKSSFCWSNAVKSQNHFVLTLVCQNSLRGIVKRYVPSVRYSLISIRAPRA